MPAMIAMMSLLLVTRCASHAWNRRLSEDVCLDRLAVDIRSQPAQSHLETLDGQQVPLSEFYGLSQIVSPLCVLPEKFYHWRSEIRMVQSKTPRGTVSHKIRVYFNYLSTCRPDVVDPVKTHGDIAEFYNEKGEFMGLGVYAGEGLYCPLPYSKYSGAGKSMRYYLMNAHVHSQ